MLQVGASAVPRDFHSRRGCLSIRYTYGDERGGRCLKEENLKLGDRRGGGGGRKKKERDAQRERRKSRYRRNEMGRVDRQETGMLLTWGSELVVKTVRIP